MGSRQDLQKGADAPRLDSLVARVRGEYSEMPGLQLTCAQACRLWHMHVSTCEQLLEQLVREGFLCKTDKGTYVATPTIRRRT
jgi:DNA-binding IclR family transcriptional regulator